MSKPAQPSFEGSSSVGLLVLERIRVWTAPLLERVGPDDIAGLVYLNNRYHDPTLGTFISVDPLVVQTDEAYIYASGNPVTWSDPTGLETFGDLNDNIGYKHWVGPTLTSMVKVMEEGDDEATEAYRQQLIQASKDHHDKPGAVDFFLPASELAGTVSDLSGGLAVVCLLGTVTPAAPIAGPCAAAAGTVSVAAGGVEVGLQVASRDVDSCSVAGLVVEAIPGPSPSEVGRLGAWFYEVFVGATSTLAYDVGCG